MRCWWPSTRCTTSSLRIDRNTTRLRNGSGSCRDRWVLWRGLECKQLWWGLFWFVFWAAFGGLVGSFGVLFTCLWFCLHFGVFLWSVLGFYLLVCGVNILLWVSLLYGFICYVVDSTTFVIVSAHLWFYLLFYCSGCGFINISCLSTHLWIYQHICFIFLIVNLGKLVLIMILEL